ncbi:MAG: hypothetical protein KAQ64_05160 [Candidatus Pacebacteria bacterium]|nr:hypothetical protein [Candidatus Paceibacterota bacterium]
MTSGIEKFLGNKLSSVTNETKKHEGDVAWIKFGEPLSVDITEEGAVINHKGIPINLWEEGFALLNNREKGENFEVRALFIKKIAS